MTNAQPPHDPVVVIETRRAYREAVKRISDGEGPIAIDAERASGYRYSQRAYLIQIFRRGSGSFLFDPPAIGEFDELQEAIGSSEWVLHAASQDLACLREVGLDPESIFDTELGARLAGIPRVGLGSVVEELLGIHLAKEHSAADWSTRPLPQSWLVYAALDVELLVDLRDAVAEILANDNKMEIARQEFAATLAKPPKPTNPEAWRRLSGLSSLRDPRALAVARELWRARDDLARETDTAPGRLLPDVSIVAAARTLPATQKDLAALKDFNGRASRSELPRWWAAIEAGSSTDKLPPVRVQNDSIPPVRAWSDRKPDADRRIKLARAALSEVSDERKIPLENLLTPELLRQLAWEPPSEVTVEEISARLRELGARPWQRDAVAHVVTKAFVEASQTDAEPEGSAS